jgi:hypothetical protein
MGNFGAANAVRRVPESKPGRFSENLQEIFRFFINKGGARFARTVEGLGV